MNSAGRRVSIIFWVGCPCSSSSQCRDGHAYGVLRIGFEKKSVLIYDFDIRKVTYMETINRRQNTPFPVGNHALSGSAESPWEGLSSED